MAATDGREGWLLVLLPLGAWGLVEVLRRIDGHASRSAIVEGVIRRAVSVDAEAQS